MASRDATALVGMIVFLGSWAMTFVALLFSFGVAREGVGTWPPNALGAVSPWLPAATTLVVIASSALLEWGRRARRGSLIAAAAACGGVFLWLQAILALELAQAGLGLQASAGAMIYALAGFHAAHAIVGVLGLAATAALHGWRRRRGAPAGHGFHLWCMFWHFVGVAWLAIYAAVFVL